MPIFRYRCRSCGAEETKLVPRFDAEVSCESCGDKALEKLPSTFAAVRPSAASKCQSAELCGNAHRCGGACGCAGAKF